MAESYAERFSGYSDERLADVLLQPDEFVPDAVAAAIAEAEERGGVDGLLAAVAAEHEREAALAAASTEVARLVRSGSSVDEIYQQAIGPVTRADIDVMIGDAIASEREAIRERTETFGSAIMSVVGGLLATIVGAVYSRYAIFGGRAIFVLLLIGLVGLCYGIVYLVAGRKSTLMVAIFTIVSIGASAYLGYLWAWDEEGFLSIIFGS